MSRAKYRSFPYTFGGIPGLDDSHPITLNINCELRCGRVHKIISATIADAAIGAEFNMLGLMLAFDDEFLTMTEQMFIYAEELLND